MLDVLEGAIKGLGLFTKMCLESGAWDVSIRKPGRLLLKLFYPPYWFRKIDASDAVVLLAGIVFWLMIGYVMFRISIIAMSAA